jgi:hypothetical protein
MKLTSLAAATTSTRVLHYFIQPMSCYYDKYLIWDTHTLVFWIHIHYLFSQRVTVSYCRHKPKKAKGYTFELPTQAKDEQLHYDQWKRGVSQMV